MPLHVAVQMSTGIRIRIKHIRVLYSLTPHLYIVKLGFIVCILFLFLLKNIYCGYSLEPPQLGGSHVFPQYIFE